jgi:cell division septum initiation protein DivIVA
MTVTTEQTNGKRFATVRRDGYDPALVDRHLEDVERASLALEAQRSGLEEANTQLRGALVTANDRARALEDQLAQALEEARAAAAVPAPQPTPVVQDAVTTASHNATRLLELATRDAEALVIGAREEAEQAVAVARAEAAEIVQAALQKVHAREEALETMAAEQREELDRVRTETLRDLEQRRAELDGEVNRLSEFESQVRSHLVGFFHEQLEVLEAPGLGGTVVEHPARSQAS